MDFEDLSPTEKGLIRRLYDALMHGADASDAWWLEGWIDTIADETYPGIIADWGERHPTG